MDSVPRLAPSPTALLEGVAPAPEADTRTGQDRSSEAGEDPYSSSLNALSLLLGSVIALVTLCLPLATVLAGRPQAPSRPLSHGPEPAAGITSSGPGQPGGGDSRR
jgi:hypothetical protein